MAKSTGLMVSASDVSRTIFLSSDPNESCNRLRLLIQEEQAGYDFDLISQEFFAKVDKLLEYKCISKKQHKELLIKFNLLHKKSKK